MAACEKSPELDDNDWPPARGARLRLLNVTDMLQEDPSLGPNSWLVEEMHDLYRQSPSLVSESWRVYFDNRDGVITPAALHATNGVLNGAGNGVSTVSPAAVPPPTPAPGATPAAAPAAELALPPPVIPVGGETSVLRGVASKIVANMELSLTVPTATSVRDVPAKLLEVQRSIINNHLKRTRGGKVSFTHLIAYAIVKALGDVPAMRNTFSRDDSGHPLLVRNTNVGLGIAVDMVKNDGSRSLVVPCIKDANTLSFRAFYNAYEVLIAKARTNKLAVEDFVGVTLPALTALVLLVYARRASATA